MTARQEHPAATRFTTLHVCTGNIGRSPMAELVMRHELQRAAPELAERFPVASCGTWGHEGSAMEPFAAEVLRGIGIDPAGFRARELRAEQVEQADLVLTATREHRAAVVALVPSAVRRVFTLKELARLLPPPAVPAAVLPGGPDGQEYPDDPVRLAAARVAGALTRRGVAAAPAHAQLDDVADPYGAPEAVYRERLAEIRDAVARVVAGLVRGG